MKFILVYIKTLNQKKEDMIHLSIDDLNCITFKSVSATCISIHYDTLFNMCTV
jgi:hypothetical protein